MTTESSFAGVIWPRALLALLILSWAFAWPAIKIGVTAIPAIWYGCLRYAIAAFCLFIVVTARRELVFPPRSDWPLVLVSGVFQMAAYSALTGSALMVLPPGRASILAFSTPIWVVPLAAWWLREYVSWRTVLGVLAGLSGVFAIAAPSFHPNAAGQFWAYTMLLGAAGAWAVSIVFVRSHRFSASALALAPWQMLTAATLLLPLAIVSEGSPPAAGVKGSASLVYVGLFATAFAYWAIVELGRYFRASTMAMSLLAAPSLGILVSALTTGEKIDASLLTGATLIAAGIILAAVET